MQVFAFIDTNVLLHYRFFREADWLTITGVEALVIVFAPVVLSELDEHKWSGSRRERPRAKAVLKVIDDLSVAADPVEIRPGVSVLTLPEEPQDATFASHRLQPSSKDDRLLASLFEFRDRDDAIRVLLLSADGGLRVKARARRIEVMAPPDSLANAEEPDETERELLRPVVSWRRYAAPRQPCA